MISFLTRMIKLMFGGCVSERFIEQSERAKAQIHIYGLVLFKARLAENSN